MINLFFVFLGVITIIFVYRKVSLKMFSEKESFFWMVSAIIILILSIFPKILDNLSLVLGIDYPPSLLFLLSTLFILFVQFRQTQQVSMLNERIKELAQINALLYEKIDIKMKDDSNK
jgi:hypothetical protein